MRIIAVAMLYLASSTGVGQLVNPGFSEAGPPGTMFAGWTTFGAVSATDRLAGADNRAARVAAPLGAGSGLAGIFQQLLASAGQWARFIVTSGVASLDELRGQTRGVANVEWRDAAGGLIAYDSETIAFSADTPDQVVITDRFVGPAPVGTAAARLVLGAFSPPTLTGGAVTFDSADLHLGGPPNQQELDDNDYGERVIRWSGHDWRVARGGFQAPGNNIWHDGEAAVRVDEQGRLRLRIFEVDGQWYSVGLAMTEPIGYGDFRFTIVGRQDQLDINSVVGLFTWEYLIDYTGSGQSNIANEFDIELSRWKNPSNLPGQFVAQPWNLPGNIDRYNFVPRGEEALTTHAFDWNATRVECRAWHGGSQDEHREPPIHTWTYTGPDIPVPGRLRILINHWLIDEPPTDGQPQEIVISSFDYRPACPWDFDLDGDADNDDVHALIVDPRDADGTGSFDMFDVVVSLREISELGLDCAP